MLAFGHRVVAHGAGDELTVVVVVRAFVERLGKTLRDAAMDLAVDDQRIEDVADIVDRDVFDWSRPDPYRDRSRPRKCACRTGTCSSADRSRSSHPRNGSISARQVVGDAAPRARSPGSSCRFRRSLYEAFAVLVDDVLVVRLQHVRRDPPGLFLDLADALVDRGAADRQRPAAVGAVSERRAECVRVLDLDIVVGNAELVRDELRERRLMSLTMRLRAGRDRRLCRSDAP